MKKSILLPLLLVNLLFANSLSCEKEENRITCTYFLDRSDNIKDITIRFEWISPTNPNDNRVKEIVIPSNYGLVYDYRFTQGRADGNWIVKVTNLDSNQTTQTSFDLNQSGLEPY